MKVFFGFLSCGRAENRAFYYMKFKHTKKFKDLKEFKKYIDNLDFVNKQTKPIKFKKAK